MASYAVIWRRPKGPIYAGRVELEQSTVRFEGTSPGRARGHVGTIPIEAIQSATVSRDRGSRLRDLPTLILELRGAAPIQVAAVDGPGKLLELTERVTAKLVQSEAA